MQYKVLALDLDGTLTNHEKVITPRTKAALQEAARRGVCIVLASGRPTVGIEPLARELELEKYGGCILSYNGGKIIDCRTGQTLVQHKLLLTGDPVDMPHVEELMQQEFAGKLSIYRSQPFFIETMPLNVEKAASLELLLRSKGLTSRNLMACGDGWNDLPMIRFAGLGVAMGNAQPPVKAAADCLTADNDHDGVGLAVEQYILSEEN